MACCTFCMGHFTNVTKARACRCRRTCVFMYKSLYARDPLNMAQRARTGPILAPEAKCVARTGPIPGWSWQHRPRIGPVLARYAKFTGKCAQ